MLKNSHHRLLPLILLLAIFILTSCAGAPTPTETLEPTEESPEPQPTETEEPDPTVVPTQSTPVSLNIDPADLAGTKIRFFHPWTGERAAVLQSIATTFSLSNAWDIWVEVEGFGGESLLIEAIQADVDSGQPPGLVAAHPYLVENLMGEYEPVDLRIYINEPQWGFEEGVLEDIPQVFLTPFMDGENLAALPVAPQATVLFYNQTWGEVLGYESPPADADAFRQQACDASFYNREDINVENDGTGGWLINFDPAVLAGWYHAYGGDLPETGAPMFDDEAGRDAFGYLKSVYDQGCFWIGRQPEPYFYFANRYALAYAGTLDQVPSQVGWMTEAGNMDEWIAMGFPGPKSQVMLVDGPGLMVTGASPEERLAAWLFARHLLEPEIQARLVQVMFTLPVRQSALDSLGEFSREYPQWAQAAAMLDIAQSLPVSQGWGLGQWVLQDAIYRLVLAEEDLTDTILEELDETILELEEMSP